MLKVVGASSWKINFSAFVLGGSLLCAVGLLLLAEIERPEYNGTYCATAFWSPKFGFRVEFWGQRNDLQEVAKGVARACYRDAVDTTGWGYFEVETQEDYPDRIQALAAGMLEGALTWAKVYDHWSNTIESDCDRDEESQKFCSWAREILEENFDNIKQEAEIKGHHSHYWYQVWLFYQQLAGFESGWELGARQTQGRNHLEIPEEDFFFLNAASDLRDLKAYYSKFIEPDYHHNTPKTGALFMKLLAQNLSTQLLFSHSSDGNYSDMLRMYKHYKFNYHYSAKSNAPLVPGNNVSFTGYPGILSSADDFYWINGKWGNFVIGGIRIENENNTVWEEVDLDDSTILGPRVMAANRLAFNGRSWCKYMSHKSGTGNKQWLLVDYKKLEAQGNAHQTLMESLNAMNEVEESSAKDLQTIADGQFVWVADQMPGKLHFRDITEEVVRKGHWFSNGLPYLEETLTMSVLNTTNHSNHQIVDQLQQNITTLSNLTHLLSCIGYRGDLMAEFQPFGNIDIKLFSFSTTSDKPEILIKSGPLYDDNRDDFASKFSRDSRKQPFSWPTTQTDWQHSSQPETFEFDFVQPEWAWTD